MIVAGGREATGHAFVIWRRGGQVLDRYRLNILGPFGLFAPDGRRIDVSSKKSMGILAYIACARNKVRTRAKLQDMFWGNRSLDQGQVSLRRELSNLRKVLRAAGAEALLRVDRHRVELGSDVLSTDVDSLYEEGGKQAVSRDELLEGMDIPGCEGFEDWLRGERQRIEAVRAELADAPPVRRSAQTGEAMRDTGIQPAARIPPKPSLAVLPFTVLAPEQPEWWGHALGEGLAEELSSFPQVLIVPNARPSERGKSAEGSRTEIAERLGVAFLLEGSLLPGEDGNIRVSVRLVAGESGEQFWSDRIELPVQRGADWLRLAAMHIAPRIWTGVDAEVRSNFARFDGVPQSNYERYWLANTLIRRWNKPDTARAAGISAELVERDPACPWANSLAGFVHALAWLLHAVEDREQARNDAMRYIAQARSCGPDNVETLGYCAGSILIAGGDLELAERIIAHAMTILPDHQPVLFWGGWIELGRGHPNKALNRFRRSLEVNPAATARGQTLGGMGIAHVLTGEFAEAREHFLAGRAADPDFPVGAYGVQAVDALAKAQGTPAFPTDFRDVLPLLSNYLAQTG